MVAFPLISHLSRNRHSFDDCGICLLFTCRCGLEISLDALNMGVIDARFVLTSSFNSVFSYFSVKIGVWTALISSRVPLCLDTHFT